MYRELFEVRKKYGSTYVTTFTDGTIVPWKPLPLEDYIRYNTDTARGLIPPSQLEDEIFKKCVIDDSLVRQMPILKAGIVTTVVLNIWQYSGPTGIDAFNRDLEMARQLLQADGTIALHKLVQLVTMAFPYKPEEVYAMDYETFLMRVAQAETKLLELQMIDKPVFLIDQNKEQEQKMKRGPRPSDPNQTFDQKPKIDAKELWEKQQEKRRKPATPKSSQAPKADLPDMSTKKWWKKSPVLEAEGKHNIDFDIEKKEHDTFGVSGHEKADLHISRATLVKDAQWIYEDLLKELASKKK